MMTRLAPARRCAAAFSLVRKIPVDSITTSTPTSPQADAAGSFTAVARMGRPSTTRKPSLTATLVPEPAVNRVVLEQIGQVGQLEEVVDRHDLDVVALHRRAERHPADAAKSVDADLDHAPRSIARAADGLKDNEIAF